MTLAIKRGDSLSYTCTDNSGDLTGAVITSGVKLGRFYEELIVTPVDLAAGTYTLSAASTDAWPVGTLVCDIKYLAGSQIQHSATFEIIVKDRVTA